MKDEWVEQILWERQSNVLMIPVLYLSGAILLKLMHSPELVGFTYTSVLKPASVEVTLTSKKLILLFFSVSKVNFKTELFSNVVLIVSSVNKFGTTKKYHQRSGSILKVLFEEKSFAIQSFLTGTYKSYQIRGQVEIP